MHLLLVLPSWWLKWGATEKNNLHASETNHKGTKTTRKQDTRTSENKPGGSNTPWRAENHGGGYIYIYITTTINSTQGNNTNKNKTTE
jgi:hypothetical protein